MQGTIYRSLCAICHITYNSTEMAVPGELRTLVHQRAVAYRNWNQQYAIFGIHEILHLIHGLCES